MPQFTPDTKQSFDFTSSSAGAGPGRKRLACLGQKTSAGSLAVNTPTQVLDELDVIAKCGPGSDLAIDLLAAMKTARDYYNRYSGESALVQIPDFYAVAVADPGSPTAATYTLTITVATAEAGDIIVEIAGRPVVLTILAGDAQNAIATALAAKINAYTPALPVTAAAATNVVTLTARCTGVHGNDIRVPKVRKKPNGVTSIVAAAGAAGVGAVDITPPLDTLVDQRYHEVVVGTHVAGDVTKLNTWLNTRWAAGAKQFDFVHMGEYGTIATGTALAAAFNRPEAHVHACEGFGFLPGELAGALAAVRATEGRLNLSFNDVTLPFAPPDAVDAFTPTEIETAGSNGLNPLGRNTVGDRIRITRYATTKTTDNSVAFDRLIDTQVLNRMAEFSLELDALWKLKFARANRDDETLEAIVSEAYSLALDYQKRKWFQNVEAHKNEFKGVKVGINGFDVTIPNPVVPHLHFLSGRNILHLE